MSEKVEGSDSITLDEHEVEGVKIEFLDMTLDSMDLVYDVSKDDSNMKVIHVRSEEILYIPYVVSRSKGDFSDMMDAVVQEFGINEIKFTMIINENLENVLKGFEKKKEFHSNIGKKAPVLVGTWYVDAPACKFCGEKMDKVEDDSDAEWICSPSSNGCEGVLYESGEYGW